ERVGCRRAAIHELVPGEEFESRQRHYDRSLEASVTSVCLEIPMEARAENALYNGVGARLGERGHNRLEYVLYVVARKPRPTLFVGREPRQAPMLPDQGPGRVVAGRERPARPKARAERQHGVEELDEFVHLVGGERCTVNSLASQGVRECDSPRLLQSLSRLRFQFVESQSPRRHLNASPAVVPTVAVRTGERFAPDPQEVRDVSPDLCNSHAARSSSTADPSLGTVDDATQAPVAAALDCALARPAAINELHRTLVESSKPENDRRDDERDFRLRKPTSLDRAIALDCIGPLHDSEATLVKQHRNIRLRSAITGFDRPGKVIVCGEYLPHRTRLCLRAVRAQSAGPSGVTAGTRRYRRYSFAGVSFGWEAEKLFDSRPRGFGERPYLLTHCLLGLGSSDRNDTWVTHYNDGIRGVADVRALAVPNDVASGKKHLARAVHEQADARPQTEMARPIEREPVNFQDPVGRLSAEGLRLKVSRNEGDEASIKADALLVFESREHLGDRPRYLVHARFGLFAQPVRVAVQSRTAGSGVSRISNPLFRRDGQIREIQGRDSRRRSSQPDPQGRGELLHRRTFGWGRRGSLLKDPIDRRHPGMVDIGPKLRALLEGADSARRGIALARGQNEQGLRERVDVGRVRTRVLWVPDHLGCDEMTRPHLPSGSRGGLLSNEHRDSEVADEPCTIALEQVLRLQVTVGDLTLRQGRQRLCDLRNGLEYSLKRRRYPKGHFNPARDRHCQPRGRVLVRVRRKPMVSHRQYASALTQQRVHRNLISESSIRLRSGPRRLQNLEGEAQGAALCLPDFAVSASSHRPAESPPVDDGSLSIFSGHRRSVPLWGAATALDCATRCDLFASRCIADRQARSTMTP